MTRALAWLCVGLGLGACRPPPCGPATCEGCCEDAVTCSSGRSRLACGTAGAACTRCGDGEVCTQQACVTAPPRPDAGERSDGGLDAGLVVACRCPLGCCLANGQCMPGLAPDACGRDGGRCGDCAPSERCGAGACVAISCAGCTAGDGRCFPGTADDACGADGGLCLRCGADERCVGGACALVPCTPASCAQGCCASATRCVTSTSSQACGIAGAPCQACDGGLCTQGACR